MIRPMNSSSHAPGRRTLRRFSGFIRSLPSLAVAAIVLFATVALAQTSPSADPSAWLSLYPPPLQPLAAEAAASPEIADQLHALLAAAHGPEAEALLQPILALPPPAEDAEGAILAFLEQLLARPPVRALFERALWEALLRLQPVATEASRSLVERIGGIPATVLWAMPGCREPIPTPVYPYVEVAAALLAQLDFQATLNALRAAPPADRAAMLLQKARAADPDSAEAAALRAAVHEWDEPARKSLREHLRASAKQASLSPTEQALLVETWLVDRVVPSPDEIEQLDPAAALALLLRSREGEPAFAEAIRRRARQHPATASAAALAAPLPAAPLGAADLRALLEADGAEGAARIAAAADSAHIAPLEALLLAPETPDALRRRAAMALLLHPDPAARERLRAAADSPRLAAPLRAKLAGWLGQ